MCVSCGACRPLTLIVGRNGSGKTTIIEALRYATTGDLPPHTKAQSFVHDPRMARQDTVYGCVKLRATAASGRPFLVTRNFQLQQQRNKTASFKTNESSIKSVDAHGNTSNVSKKCSDINSEVPMLLGVSKAVLDNVIFVHQEDASWPLGDPKAVKERFDDIFAATKYTKALEEIRKQRTEMNNQVKQLKEGLKAAKEKKQRAEECRSNEYAYKQRVQELEQHVEQLEAEINETLSRVSAAEHDLEQAREREREISNIHEKRASVENEITDKQQHIQQKFETDLTESMHELKEKANKIENTMDDLHHQSQAAEAAYNEAKSLADNAKERHESVLQHCNRIQAELKAKKEQRDRLIEKAQEHAYSCLPHDMYISLPQMKNLDNVKATQKALSSYSDSLERELQELQHQHEKNARNEEEALQKAQQEELRVEAAANQKQEELKNAKHEIDETERKLEDQPEVDETAINKAKEEANRLRSRAQEAQNELDGKQKEELQRLRHEYDECAREAQTLNDEYRRKAQYSEASAAARAKKNDANRKRNDAFDRIKRKGDDLEKLMCDAETALGLSRPISLFSDDPRKAINALASLVDQIEQVVTDLSHKLDEARKDVMEVDAEVKQAEKNVDLVYKEESRLRQVVESSNSSGLSADEVEKTLTQLDNDLEKAIRSDERCKTLTMLCDKFVQNAKDNSSCYWCGFEMSSSELETTRHDVEAYKSKTTERQNENSQRIQDLRARRRNFSEAAQVAEQWRKKRDEDIPAAKSHLENMKQKAKEREQPEKDASTNKAEASDIHFRASQLKSQFEQAFGILKESERQQHEAEAQEPAVFGETEERTLEQIEKESKEAEMKKRKAEKARDEAQELYSEKQQEVSRLYSDAQKFEEKLESIRHASHERMELQSRRNDAKTASERYQNELIELNKKLEQQQMERSKLQSAVDALKAKQREEYESKQKLVRKVKAALEQIEDQESAAKCHELETEFAKAKQDEEGARNDRDVKLDAASTRYREWTDASNRLKSSDHVRSHINECLKLREIEQRAQELDNRRKDLEEKVQSDGDALTMKQVYDDESNVLIKKREQRSESKGKAKETKELHDREAQKLRNPELENADSEYEHKQVEMRTAELAEQDLQQWYNSLDTSLQKFHERKMSEVNQVLRELWQKTYTGADIDLIEVKSEPARQSGSGRSRSYDYRLVMHCGGVELDMRGRCSAGQRVLACIIVRLALAETFCLNCGVLALDEPSANLDEINAASLAESLRGIMDSRRGQANFQLIVITHEKRFAESLGQNRHADYYWRITKNAHGNSEIEREELVVT